MAYITKRDSSYGVRYTYQDEQGKNCNKWESFSTKEEATNRKKQIEHELANGTFLIPSTITVKEFLMEWLPKQCNKHKWAPCTGTFRINTCMQRVQKASLAKTGKDCILQEFEDKHEGSTTTLVLKKTIAVCVFNAQATSANCISQICRFDRHYL